MTANNIHRKLVSGATQYFDYVTGNNVLKLAPTVVTVGQNLVMATGKSQLVADDALLKLGTDGDVVLVNRTTVLNATTALSGVLIGTPVTPAVAANSLILSNVTASGDILVVVNEGGHSQAYMWIDASAGLMKLYGSGTEALSLSATAITASLNLNVTGNVTATNTTLAATGRVGKFQATAAAAAHTDGYGAFEVDVTLSGSPTDHSAASSSWMNITGGTVPTGTYICARNDGIYEDAAATVTNAKIVFGARMQYIFSDTDALRFPFSLNTNNAAITALFDCNNITDFGTVATGGSSAVTLLPILRDAGGTLKYVLLYDL